MEAGAAGTGGAKKGVALSRPAASVVIVNFNGAAHLPACLDSLAAQDVEGGFEILVVDNGSADGSQELLRGRSDVRLLEAGRNLGFAAGNNLGFKEARGRRLVMLNSDARVRPGWLRALLEAASGERVGAVTSKLVFADRPGVIQNAGQLLLSDGSGGDRGSGEEDRGQYQRREEVFGFCGAAALLTRDAYEDAGGFDERFFMYYEDLDLSWRLRLRGWSILYEPEAVVEHVHAAGSVEWSPFFTFHVDRNRLFAIYKNARPGFLARSYSSLLRRRGGGGASTRPPSPKPRIAASFLRNLPGLTLARARIRSRRRVADAAVERWLYPRETWDRR